MNLKIDAKFEEKLICCFKNDKNLVKFDEGTWKCPKTCTFIRFYCAKYLMLDLKEELTCQNWHDEFDKFSPEHLKVPKKFTLMCSFWAKYILFELKKVQRRYLPWNWRGIQNLERVRFVVSKLTWGIWQILTWRFESLKNFHFNGLL